MFVRDAASSEALGCVLEKRNGQAGLSEEDWASVAFSGVAGTLATVAAEGTKGTALAKALVGGERKLGFQVLSNAYEPATLAPSQENAYRRMLLMRSCHNECKEVYCSPKGMDTLESEWGEVMALRKGGA
jgi:hypothetical protein